MAALFPSSRPVHKDRYGRRFTSVAGSIPAPVSRSETRCWTAAAGLYATAQRAPHVPRAREAVAWTFGLAAEEFRQFRSRSSRHSEGCSFAAASLQRAAARLFSETGQPVSAKRTRAASEV